MTLEVHYMKSLVELYPNGYLEETYFNKMCINCRNKCSNCTGLIINRSYERYKGEDIPTVVYKCNKFSKKS
jgi:hypothetical protein